MCIGWNHENVFDTIDAQCKHEDYNCSLIRSYCKSAKNFKTYRSRY